jgi:hypothetical protein
MQDPTPEQEHRVIPTPAQTECDSAHAHTRCSYNVGCTEADYLQNESVTERLTTTQYFTKLSGQVSIPSC